MSGDTTHRPGPKRMVGRQVDAPRCWSCGEPWPCDGSWQGRAEAAEATLAEVRQVIATFQTHYGHSELPSFKVARDLAEGIRQVLDREPMP